MKHGSDSSLARAVLFRRELLAVLRRRMAKSSLQAVFFTSTDVPQGARHSVRRLHGQNAEKRRDRGRWLREAAK